MTARDFLRTKTFDTNEENLIEFTKIHLEEAMKAAAIKAVLFMMICETKEEYEKFFLSVKIEETALYKQIIESYPLNNIK
ncbi:MAG: hypothetical protein ABIP51_16900 [Bacteroidia bacterium]